jgi:hypothetical protein
MHLFNKRHEWGGHAPWTGVPVRDATNKPYRAMLGGTCEAWVATNGAVAVREIVRLTDFAGRQDAVFFKA